ncbi:O-antigen translocase [Enterobacter kobei]|uniref:O-antigen translocase n=1 Tax=Enterobacter kobei TaxID=208224 RepID=A0AAW3XQ12_9ENTR|nr:O-antigen translocase [Enterobacter kobei]KJM93937.1 WzxB protein [Enterobacter kobei]MBC6325876.1 O-antigen translocase [Enterobacter kobei]MBG0680816.1 O-antigen translocase [Enterobacter kobei]MBW4189199.1 O-antigen translocase [Enterobacter kobei]MCU2428894.1 O-antigen translocase [Enterobacter kobei]
MKKLLSVTFFTGLLTLSRMMAGFLISKFIAVYTGTTGMALLGQAQNLITMLNGIVNAPTSNAVVRYTSEYCDKGYAACAPWWRASLQWAVIFCISLIPSGIFLSRYISFWLFETTSYSWLISVMFLALPLSALSTLINSVINGQQQYKRYISLGIIAVIVSTTVMITLIMIWGINGALVAASIQSALIGIVMLISCIRQPWMKLNLWWGSVKSEHRLKIGGYILMAVASAVSMPLALIAVRKIIIANVGWDAAGQWQAVWKISEVYLSVMTMALSIYFLPQLAKLKTYKEIRQEINSTALIIVPIVIFMALFVYLVRDFAITILFTEKFRDARELFGIQLIGDVLKISSWLYAYPMLSRGATKWFVSSEIFFAVSLVLMTAIFVPYYKTDGANIAYMINYCVYFVFVCTMMKYIIRDDYAE